MRFEDLNLQALAGVANLQALAGVALSEEARRVRQTTGVLWKNSEQIRS
jgi:hypothetical protein